MCQIYASAQEAMSEGDVGMLVRSQWAVVTSEGLTKLIMTRMQPRATEAETPCWAGDWGVMELSFPDLLYTVQFRTLLYCAVHCVTPPAAVLILSYNIIIILARSVIIRGPIDNKILNLLSWSWGKAIIPTWFKNHNIPKVRICLSVLLCNLLKLSSCIMKRVALFYYEVRQILIEHELN